MTYSPEYLEPLSAAIGRVVVEWNRIEYGVLELAHRLAGCVSHTAIGDSADLLHIALLNMDLRSRILTAKAYGAMCNFDDNLYKDMDRLLDKIEKNLAPQRNKFVHSLSFCDYGQPQMVTAKVLVDESGPDKAPRLNRMPSKAYRSIEDAAEFGKRLTAIYDELSVLEGRASLTKLYKTHSQIAKELTM
jgi:hypothetical protein